MGRSGLSSVQGAPSGLFLLRLMQNLPVVSPAPCGNIRDQKGISAFY